jgi:hypothetical protein
MAFQEWRTVRSSGSKRMEPVCPECLMMGYWFCDDCLRWLCRNHFGDHRCSRKPLFHLFSE